MSQPGARRIGNRLAPVRFVLFVLVMAIVASLAHWQWHAKGAAALTIGFDVAALAFFASLPPLLRDCSVAGMRRHAADNDANRALVLAITVLVSAIVLAAISAELPDAKKGSGLAIAMLVGTLALSWVFTNLVFMLHYAHMFYLGDAASGEHRGGFDFPGTAHPDYWDFLYFAFTAGMSFAASDVDVTRGAVRRVVVLHCLLSFVFNIGALAFTINVLASLA